MRYCKRNVKAESEHLQFSGLYSIFQYDFHRVNIMKRRNSFFFYVVFFVLAQFAWMGLLGLWIYWYVSNYLIFEQVEDKLSPQIIIDSPNVFIFVGGIILIIAIAFWMSVIFKNLSLHIKIARLHDSFIANITHELKSPLSSIQLYLETLTKRNVEPDVQKKFLQIMLKDTNRLNNLISSILEISKYEQKRSLFDFHVYDADETLKQILNETAEHFNLTGESFSVEGELSSKYKADLTTLRILFNNLTDNAVKYSTGKVEIKAQLIQQKKKIIIHFKDSGIGIPPAHQKKIFNKFHRIYGKNIPSVKGTGLGLFYAREIIKKHDGTISVTSAGEEKGSLFKIEIPVYSSSRKRFIKELIRSKEKENNKTTHQSEQYDG
jgi:signal transduction histidine kinase